MFGFPVKVSWPNIASLPRNVSSSSQQIPSEVSDFPIPNAFSRHWGGRDAPPRPPAIYVPVRAVLKFCCTNRLFTKLIYLGICSVARLGPSKLRYKNSLYCRSYVAKWHVFKVGGIIPVPPLSSVPDKRGQKCESKKLIKLGSMNNCHRKFTCPVRLDLT